MASEKLCYVIASQPQERCLDRDELTIGRLPTMHLALPEWIAGISRHHATIRRKDTAWWIDDVGSRYGTFVNRQRVTSAELHDGDVIHLGEFELRFVSNLVATPLEAAPGPVFSAQTQPQDLDSAESQHPSVSFSERESLQVSLSINLANLEVMQGAAGQPLGMITPPGAQVPRMPPTAQPRAFGPDQAWAIALFSDVGKTLQLSTDLDEMFKELLSLLFTHVPAERGLIGLLDPVTHEIVPRVTRTVVPSPGQTFELSHTILHTAIDSQNALLVEDTVSDARFRQALSVRRLAIHSAICVPLYHEGRVSGVLYLDTRDAMAPFQQRDLEIATAQALFMAVAVEQFQLREQAREAERKRQRLARYSSPSVVDYILRVGDDAQMLADKEDVSVLFADLIGFTARSEKLPPVEVVNLLNAVFTRLSEMVFRHQGTLDKFIGDGMLAFFGAPLRQPDHAARAVRAAWDMQAAIAEFNAVRGDEPPIALRIGVNSGPVVVGDIGSLTRKEYTVIGDTVNVASRLESSVAGANQIAIGPSTYEAVKDEFDCQALDPVRLKGKSATIQAYRVIGLSGGSAEAL